MSKRTPETAQLLALDIWEVTPYPFEPFID